MGMPGCGCIAAGGTVEWAVEWAVGGTVEWTVGEAVEVAFAKTAAAEAVQEQLQGLPGS